MRKNPLRDEGGKNNFPVSFRTEGPPFFNKFLHFVYQRRVNHGHLSFLAILNGMHTLNIT